MSEGKIFGLVGQAMQLIGAVGKDSRNQQQGFQYRGIDAVMNALNPVMAKLGLFMTPEVLEQTREERQGRNGGNLLYSVMKIRYTLYAPDGSNVSCVVVGEGMDSGDKASNKAMSIAFKYAAFQLFCIPTEEMVDPDAECHEVMPRNQAKQGEKPAHAPAKANAPTPAAQAAKLPENREKTASVTTTDKVPPVAQAQPAEPVNPVLQYLAKEREALRVVRNVSKAENNAIWKAQVKALQDAKLAPVKPLAEFTQQEAEYLVGAMYANFTPTGTVLKDDGKTA